MNTWINDLQRLAIFVSTLSSFWFLHKQLSLRLVFLNGTYGIYVQHRGPSFLTVVIWKVVVRQTGFCYPLVVN